MDHTFYDEAPRYFNKGLLGLNIVLAVFAWSNSFGFQTGKYEEINRTIKIIRRHNRYI